VVQAEGAGSAELEDKGPFFTVRAIAQKIRTSPRHVQTNTTAPSVGPAAFAPPYLTSAKSATYLRYRSASAMRNLVLSGRLVPAGRRGRGLGDDGGWGFSRVDGELLPKSWLRWAMISVLMKTGIKKRVTIHGLRRTFNNLSRQVTGEIVTRSITGHVTQAMTEHHSHVGAQEKLAAAENIVRMVLGTPDATPRRGSGGGAPSSHRDDTSQSEPNLLN
jgi:hypothetical protein